MKKIFAITTTLFLLPHLTNAKELNIKNSLTNPLYMPETREFRIFSDIQYYKREYNLENNTTNVKISDNKEEGIFITEGFQYGIDYNLTFIFQLMYDHYKEHNTLVGQSTQEYKYSGLENPKLGLEDRIMDNGRGKIDFGLAITPDLFDRETTTNRVYEGSPANGRNEVEFLVRYGQDFKHFAIAGTTKITYLDSAKYQRISDKQFFIESGHRKYEFLLETEYRLIKRLTANTNAGYIVEEEYDLSNQNTTLIQSSQPGNIFYTTMQLNYSFIPEFTLSLYYTYENIEETYLKYKAGPATNDQVREDDRRDIYGIKTAFRF